MKGLIVTGLITILILIGGIVLVSKGSNTPQNQAPVDPNLLIRESSHKSAKGAPVTIVEFGDYQCPACDVVFPDTQKIIKEYGNKVNFVFRNFPLPQHKNAQISAEAAEAANAQGKFWEMHDKLYENQKDWGESNNPIDKFVAYAKDLKLDVDKFKKEVESQKYANIIGQDMNDGNNLKVSATPTFYINGGAFPGVPSYEDFKGIIDSILNKK